MMKLLGVVEMIEHDVGGGGLGRTLWRLSRGVEDAEQKQQNDRKQLDHVFPASKTRIAKSGTRNQRNRGEAKLDFEGIRERNLIRL
jgi:hypothetical protein